MRWCPEFIVRDGTNVPLQDVIAEQTLPYMQTPEMMWLILTTLAIVPLLFMIPLKKWFEKGMRDDPTAEIAA